MGLAAINPVGALLYVHSQKGPANFVLMRDPLSHDIIWKQCSLFRTASETHQLCKAPMIHRVPVCHTSCTDKVCALGLYEEQV